MERSNDWWALAGMFTRPRRTIAGIVADERYASVLLLAMLAGMFDVLERMADFRVTLSIARVALVAGVGGSLGGLLMLYLSGWLMHACGRWYGGKASAPALRAALAWGRVPFLVAGVLFLARLALTGGPGAAGWAHRGFQASAFWAVFFLDIAGAILATWSLVSSVAAVSEVQDLSIARTVGSFVMAGVMFGVLLMITVSAVSLLRG